MLKQHNYHITRGLVTAIAVTFLLMGCGERSQDLKRFQAKPDGPTSEGTGIDMRYLDSGKVKAHLKAPYLKSFANESFPYDEFPKGIDLVFIDDDQKENFIRSDYAIQYKQTGLVDLRKNVVLITNKKDTLKADQLYWDSNKHWIFTDQPYTLVSADGSRNDGDLFDSSEDFTNFVSLNNTSKQYLKDDDLTTENDTIR